MSTAPKVVKKVLADGSVVVQFEQQSHQKSSEKVKDSEKDEKGDK